MREIWAACMLALVMPMAAIAQSAPSDASGSQPIATRQTAFSIPFQVDRAAPNPPAEVQLHVSADRGARWDVYDKVKPDRGSFVFRAPHDGEYWFCIRSLDKQGTVAPAGQLTPGLKVVVDTLAPRLDVTAERLPAGELSAQWQIVDPALNPDSLRIEYRTDDTAEWQELAASQARITEGRSTLTGDGIWWPQKTQGPLTLRIQVADRAGNPAVTQVVIKPVGGTAEAPSLGDPNVANVPRRDPRAFPVSSRAAEETDVEANPFDRYRNRPNAVDPSFTSAPVLPSEPPPSRAWPTQGANSRPLETTGDESSGWRVGNRPGGGSTPGFVHPTASSDNVNRSRNGEIDSRGSLGRSANAQFDFVELAPSERPKMVNSRTFQIDYEIESVGAAGVAKVELFGTRDGGQTWTSLGTDPDNRSPLVVTVNGEGLYGFHVVVQSASGLSGVPPRSGQRPELWIGVDLTKPQATLTGAEPGNNPDELVIYWDARDRRLESRPVALYFSNQVGGPWSPIAAGLENTGNYTWRMDNRVREQLYLKLEVRDEAGNIGRFETPEPISLNRQLPQGRIRDVRPVAPDAGGEQAKRPELIENQFAR